MCHELSHFAILAFFLLLLPRFHPGRFFIGQDRPTFAKYLLSFFHLPATFG